MLTKPKPIYPSPPQEIDRVIEKLEFEMKKARDDSEKSSEARIGRLKAKHETEIGEHCSCSCSFSCSCSCFLLIRPPS